MGTHTDIDPTESTIERALQRHIDDLGDSHRSLAPVMKAARQREKRVKVTRVSTALCSVTALLVAGVAVTQLNRPGDESNTVVADTAPDLRLIPTWFPGDTKSLSLRLSRADTAPADGYVASWWSDKGIVAASTIPTADASLGISAEASLQSRLIDPENRVVLFEPKCTTRSENSWTLAVCVDEPLAQQIDEFADRLAIGKDGQIVERELPAGTTGWYNEKWSRVKPLDEWDIGAGSVRVRAVKESTVAREIRKKNDERGGRPRTSMGESFFERRIPIRGHDAIELASNGAPREGVSTSGYVEWVEGDWFIKVTGTVSDLSTLRKVAESLRPATEKEWQQLATSPNSPTRVSDDDLVPAVDFASGEIGDVAWTAKIAATATEQGCVNVIVSSTTGESFAECVLLNDQPVMFAATRELGDRNFVIAVVTDAVDLVTVVSASGASEAVGVEGLVISDRSKWRWVGMALLPGDQSADKVEAFAEEIVTSDDPEDTTPNPRTSLGVFPIGR